MKPINRTKLIELLGPAKVQKSCAYTTNLYLRKKEKKGKKYLTNEYNTI